MSNQRKDYKLYLIDVKTSCTRIIRYTKNKSKTQFVNNQILIDAVARNIEIIGEAGSKIPSKIRKDLPQISWKQLVGMRNKLIHEYFDLNIDVLWSTIIDDVPVLKRQLSKVIKDLNSNQLKLKI